MPANRLSLKKTTSLNAQIRDAERQLSNHQQTVAVATSTLIRDIHRQMTASSSLLLASGIGFIMAEFSKCPPPELPDTSDNPQTVETTTMKTALNWMISAYTLYTALPVTRLRKWFHQSGKKLGLAKRLNRVTKALNLTKNVQNKNS